MSKGEVESDISLRAVRNMVKNNTDKRVSEDALVQLRNLLEAYGEELSTEAIQTAERDDRVTVRDTDIKQGLYNRRKTVAEEEASL